MTPGAWQVRILVKGGRGSGELVVPVPTLPRRTRGMQAALGALLVALLLPGLSPAAAVRRRARAVMAATALLLWAGLWGSARAGGAKWCCVMIKLARSPDVALGYPSGAGVKEMATILMQLSQQVRLVTFLRHPRGPKKLGREKKYISATEAKAHVSTAHLLAAAAQTAP